MAKTKILEHPTPTTDPDLSDDGASFEGEPESIKRARGRVAQIASELSDAGMRGAKKVTKANEKDWEEFLAVLFGYLSMLMVWWLLVGTGARRQDREEFELSEDETLALARPASRILARSWINARWGKNVLGGSDYVVLAIVLTEYGERVAPLFRAKIDRLNPFSRRQQVTPSRTRRNESVVEEPGRPQPRAVNSIFPASAT